MRLGRNLLAALTNSLWSAFVGLAVVPFYLNYLGVEAYGLVGFFAMTQALLQLLDFGLAPTLNREVARCSISSRLCELSNLLHTLAVIYWLIAILIGLVVVAAAPIIAQHWLQPESLSPETVIQAVMLIGVIVACRWPIGLYLGVVMGAQRLVLASSISIVMTTVGNFGAVAVLTFVSPTIQAFFIWQAAVALAYVAVVRSVAWHVIDATEDVRFDIQELRRIWRFSAGVSGVAVTALVLVQLDRIILSRMLSLEDFGRYTMGALVASGLYVILTPVFNVVYPRLSALVALGDTANVINLYRYGTRLLLSVLFPVAIMAALFAEELVTLWTGDAGLARHVGPIVSLFLVSTALNGAMHFPYALQLAYGVTRLPLLINILLIALLAPSTIYLALRYGAVGGALAAAALNAFYLFIGTFLTHRVLLKGLGRKWLLEDVGIPLTIALIIVGGGVYLTQDYSDVSRVVVGLGCVLSACISTLIVSPKLMHVVCRHMVQNPGSAAIS